MQIMKAKRYTTVAQPRICASKHKSAGRTNALNTRRSVNCDSTRGIIVRIPEAWKTIRLIAVDAIDETDPRELSIVDVPASIFEALAHPRRAIVPAYTIFVTLFTAYYYAGASKRRCYTLHMYQRNT